MDAFKQATLHFYDGIKTVYSFAGQPYDNSNKYIIQIYDFFFTSKEKTEGCCQIWTVLKVLQLNI